MQQPSRRFLTLDVPTVGGGTPTAYGAPLVRDADDFGEADVAFLGIQWGAPIEPEHIYLGLGTQYGVSGASPGLFRRITLRHRGGFLPELDRAVFDSFRLVDAGDILANDDMEQLLERVEDQVRTIRQADCAVITYGGNAGPASYAVVEGIAKETPGPVAIVNFDAHGDNRIGNWRTEDTANSSWGSTWNYQVLDRPEIDVSRYRHVGLRGPVNDRGVLERFRAQGVERGQIISYPELKRARRTGFDEWTEDWARDAVGDAPAVWIAVDIDVLDMGSNPDYADEPLGLSADELIDMVAAVTRVAGRERFAGLSFMAVPPGATRLHMIASYVILHALAAVAGPANANPPAE